MMSSSKRGESSWSLTENQELGVSTMDIFTDIIQRYFESVYKLDSSISEFLNYCVKHQRASTISYSHTMNNVTFKNTKARDYFGSYPIYSIN